MTRPIHLRLQVHGIEPPYICGTDTDKNLRRVRITNPVYDIGAVHEGDTVMLLGLTPDDEDSTALNAHRLILEPDYLVDISSLSACFSECGPHPMRYLLSMLAPKEVTRHILLGNTANQFLDDCVNDSPERPASYGTSVRKAFSADALKFAVCPDINAAFFQEALGQYEHIRNSVEALHRRYPEGLQAGGAMLEPSFICPMLGLQGRLDYLQRDLRCLVELKSGKADEYYSTPQGPKQSHTAQLLLYREMLHLGTGIPRNEIASLLLYSRYPRYFNGDNYPHIVDEALALRNAIVGLMRHLATGDDTEALFATLTPDELNTRPLGNRLWTDYIRPQLATQLAPFRTASDTTRTYFYRYLRFTAGEQYLSKVGRNGRDRAQSHLWCRTNEEKLADGDIINNLTLQSFTPDDGCGYDMLTFALPPLHTTEVPNFRRGDMILFYIKEDDSDNVSNRQVHKGTLLHIGRDILRIGLRQHQHSADVFPPSVPYALEHDVSDSASSALYRNLYSMLTAPEERCRLLLGEKLPAIDTTQDIVGHYPGEETDSIVRTIRQARDYALIVGAPGAGKTSIILRSIIEEHYRHTTDNILLMAYTNRAVDEICQALDRIAGQPAYIRLGSEQSCDERYAAHTLTRQTATLHTRDEVRSLIASTRIFVSTVSTAAARPELFAAKQFQLTLIDEASQILEPQVIGLLASTNSKFVLIGDHKQLPAIALQTEQEALITEPQLTALGFTSCKQSLFERLHHRLVATGHTHSIATLYRQGRMHPEVSSFANRHFYGGRLAPVPLPHQEQPLGYTTYDASCPMQTLVATHRTAFIPCPEPTERERFKTNTQEARLCARLVSTIIGLYESNGIPYDAPRTIGIIAPFRGQGALIRHELEALNMPHLTDAISIDTVERYQGSQRDIIIYCTTVTEPSQLELIVEGTLPNPPLKGGESDIAKTPSNEVCLSTEPKETLNPKPSTKYSTSSPFKGDREGLQPSTKYSTSSPFKGDREGLQPSTKYSTSSPFKGDREGLQPSPPLDRKLNVAVTRARGQLFVIGIPRVLATDANYRALMQEL